MFVCNVHSTDNICVNLSGENYSVSVLHCSSSSRALCLNFVVTREHEQRIPYTVEGVHAKRDVHVSFPQILIKPKGLELHIVAKSKLNAIFHLEIQFWNLGLPFKKSFSLEIFHLRRPNVLGKW